MSAFGPKRTSLVASHMSALGGKPDMLDPEGWVTQRGDAVPLVFFRRGRHGEGQRHHLSREDVVVASTNSIFTLCWPGGSPAMSTVLLSLASAHNQGRSSTFMCKCPTRGDAWSAPSRTRVRCARSPLGTGPRRCPGPAPLESGDPR